MFIFDSDIDNTDDIDTVGRDCRHTNNRKGTSIIVLLTPHPVVRSIGSDNNRRIHVHVSVDKFIKCDKFEILFSFSDGN